MDLQLSSRHWEAPSAHAWASLHPWTRTPKNIHFRPLLQILFQQPGTTPSVLKDQHHALPVILTIMRMLWTFTELDTSPALDFFPKEQRSHQTRVLLLNVLNQFVVSPCSWSGLDSSRSTMEVVHRVQTVHMAHIVSGGAFTDWLYPLLRGGSEFESAKQKMRTWAAEDYSRVRDQAFRCGQVLGLVRNYPFNMPQEAFNVYHAGTLLWCLSSILAEGNPWHTSAPSPICRLDLFEDNHSVQFVELENWIKDGTPCRLSLHEVSDLLSEHGRLQLLHQTAEILRSLRVWGISQNFTRVILKLAKKESQTRTWSAGQN